jgi:hypothetical protein
VRLLVLLLTTYLAAHAATAFLVTGRLELTPELAVIAVGVSLAEWGTLALVRRLFGRRIKT